MAKYEMCFKVSAQMLDGGPPLHLYSVLPGSDLEVGEVVLAETHETRSKGLEPKEAVVLEIGKTLCRFKLDRCRLFRKRVIKKLTTQIRLETL
jgi:hypothetical protein